MHPSTLADRLRDIVKPGSGRRGPGSGLPLAPDAGTLEPAARRREPGARSLAALGGTWRADAHRCFVVERSAPAAVRHGCLPVAEWAGRLAAGLRHLPLLVDRSDRTGGLVFFDLETTGLAGGAGTCAFLVGLGWFSDAGTFDTRQYLLTSHADEAELLGAVANDLGAAGVLVSFNGKSFDAPLLEMRYLFHRIPWTPRDLPHLDVLHPARRFWGARREGWGGGPRERECSLRALESSVLGARRLRDVHGAEIPARYFTFVRSGDASVLSDVLEHNRLDLLSLACVTSTLLHLLDGGADRAATPPEAIGLGRLYAAHGLEDDARAAYMRALAIGAGEVEWFEAARGLARLERRARRFADAARWWRMMLETPGCRSALAQEAAEALAVHHEHRARDLEAARGFAARSLAGARTARARQIEQRLARLDRKLDRRGPLLG